MLISPDDKNTIIAILTTHAEMQNRRVLQATEMLAAMRHANAPAPIHITQASLQAEIAFLEDDSANLTRIADALAG